MSLNTCSSLEQVPQTCKIQTEDFHYFQLVSARTFRKKDVKGLTDLGTHLLSSSFPAL